MARLGVDGTGKQVAAIKLGKVGGKAGGTASMARLGVDGTGRQVAAVQMGLGNHHDTKVLTSQKGKFLRAIGLAHEAMDVGRSTSEQEQVLVGFLIDVLPTGLSVDEFDFCKVSERTYQPKYLGRALSVKVVPSNALAKTTLVALLSALESEYSRPFLVGHLKKGTLDLTMLRDVLKRVMTRIRTRGSIELYECPRCSDDGEKCQTFRDMDALVPQIRCIRGTTKVGYNGVHGCGDASQKSDWETVLPDWKNLENPE